VFHSVQASIRQGDLHKAESIIAETLAQVADDPRVNLFGGQVAAQLGHYETAIERFRIVLGVDPAQPESLSGIAHSFLGLGSNEEAEPYVNSLLRIQPRNLSALHARGILLARQGSLIEALNLFEQILREAPHVALFHQLKGDILVRLFRDEEAIHAYRKASELNPNNPYVQMDLAGLLMVQGDLQQSHTIAKRIVVENPKLASARVLLGRTHTELRQIENADEQLQVAVALDPKAETNYGIWLLEEGRMGEGVDRLKRSLALDPNDLLANYWLSEAISLRDPADPVFARAHRAASDPSLHPELRMYATFTAGRVLDRAKQYDEAFRFIEQGNQIGNKFHFGQTAKLASGFDSECKAASAYRKISRPNRPQTSDVPIFIVGMIRSGTTLLDQMLARHESIGSAGELRFWSNHGPKAMSNPNRLKGLDRPYLETLKRSGEHLKRIIDKAPLNFRFLGPIHDAFPNAKMIHIRRQPLDTALSIFMMMHTRPPAFAFSQARIVEAYRGYEKLMDIWRNHVPSEALLEVDYENLVSDAETIIRKTLAFLDLEWDPSCLSTAEKSVAVRTPSLMQVRQPIYQTSVNRWRNYEAWLGSLLELKEE
jgi:tetratricopeptide (TPR) repeat protein